MPETQESDSLPGILARIVETKQEEVRRLQGREQSLSAAAEGAPRPRDFASALRREGEVALIAECKRRSPGAGDIRAGLDPVDLTRGYERAGAAALSVLTDATYFGGCLDDLRRARASVSLPVLRKDFIVHPLQLLEARAAGADAVLLIVRILDDASLSALLARTRELGMGALVEVHDAREVERALNAGADIVGINNRDLSTFTTTLGTTLELLHAVPAGTTVVSESGIRGPDDVAELGGGGVDAVLVGETLLRAEDPGRAAGTLAGHAKATRSRA